MLWARYFILTICRRTTKKAALRHHRRKSPRRKRLSKRARRPCVKLLRFVATEEIVGTAAVW